MAHSRAKLTPFGRRLLVDRVERLGWTVAAASEALGVSSATGHKWCRRYREEGAAGLEDRCSRPRHSPRRLSGPAEQRILRTRSFRGRTVRAALSGRLPGASALDGVQSAAPSRLLPPARSGPPYRSFPGRMSIQGSCSISM